MLSDERGTASCMLSIWCHRDINVSSRYDRTINTSPIWCRKYLELVWYLVYEGFIVARLQTFPRILVILTCILFILWITLVIRFVCYALAFPPYVINILWPPAQQRAINMLSVCYRMQPNRFNRRLWYQYAISLLCGIVIEIMNILLMAQRSCINMLINVVSYVTDSL